jgi:hypothetical protein
MNLLLSLPKSNRKSHFEILFQNTRSFLARDVEKQLEKYWLSKRTIISPDKKKTCDCLVVHSAEINFKIVGNWISPRQKKN